MGGMLGKAQALDGFRHMVGDVARSRYPAIEPSRAWLARIEIPVRVVPTPAPAEKPTDAYLARSPAERVVADGRAMSSGR